MVGECNTACAPLEQRYAEPVLEKPYLLSYRPMGDVQIFRCFNKAGAPSGGLKCSDRIQGW